MFVSKSLYNVGFSVPPRPKCCECSCDPKDFELVRFCLEESLNIFVSTCLCPKVEKVFQKTTQKHLDLKCNNFHETKKRGSTDTDRHERREYKLHFVSLQITWNNPINRIFILW